MRALRTHLPARLDLWDKAVMWPSTTSQMVACDITSFCFVKGSEGRFDGSLGGRFEGCRFAGFLGQAQHACSAKIAPVNSAPMAPDLGARPALELDPL